MSDKPTGGGASWPNRGAAILQKYSPRSIGNTAPVKPAGGLCPVTGSGHHWIIEPVGEREHSTGRCRYCGSSEVFCNLLGIPFTHGKAKLPGLTELEDLD